jgi:acyl carrier protein
MSLLYQRIQQVFREVLDNDGLLVTQSMTSDDVPGWDSFAQVKLVIALEEEFQVKFTTDEVATISSVDGLARALAAKGVPER